MFIIGKVRHQGSISRIPNFEEDYATSLNTVDDIMGGIDNDMSDLDIVIYLNETLKDMTTYTYASSY